MHTVTHVYSVTAIGVIDHDEHLIGLYATRRTAETVEARLRAYWCEAHRLLPAFDPVASIDSDEYNELHERWRRGVRVLDPPPEGAECLREWLYVCEPAPEILIEAQPVRNDGDNDNA